MSNYAIVCDENDMGVGYVERTAGGFRVGMPEADFATVADLESFMAAAAEAARMIGCANRVVPAGEPLREVGRQRSSVGGAK